jgi:hypothetical protein
MRTWIAALRRRRASPASDIEHAEREIRAFVSVLHELAMFARIGERIARSAPNRRQ